MIKKVLFQLLLICCISKLCFSQELTVARVDRDGTCPDYRSWPGNMFGWSVTSEVKTRWDNLFNRYNLVRFEDDPFNPNEFMQRIASAAWNAVIERYGYHHIYDLYYPAYTVYLTMENRRFICLLILYNNCRSYTYWAYEIR